jgi:hypothetical protein
MRAIVKGVRTPNFDIPDPPPETVLTADEMRRLLSDRRTCDGIHGEFLSWRERQWCVFIAWLRRRGWISG